ncbi:MAG: methyltransferase domain-containing protein [Bdellovibrionales bacterium]|nr:methyltransferase domain-containing protein [Oligoflexia bacterium]
MKNLVLRMPGRGAILDVGAGCGEFLKSLSVAAQFEKKVAVDLQPERGGSLEGVTWVKCDLNEAWQAIEDKGFDCLVGIEVIEHLENPRHFIRECNRVLRKNGILIITTPNNESFRSMLSLLIRGHFVDFLDSNYPAHITPVVRMDLLRVLNENRFELIEVGYSPWGTLPFFTTCNWEQLTFGLARGKRFGSHLYVMAKKSDD